MHLAYASAVLLQFFFIAAKNLVLNPFWNCIFHFLGGFTYFPKRLFTNILFFSFSKKFEKCVFFVAVSYQSESLKVGRYYNHARSVF